MDIFKIKLLYLQPIINDKRMFYMKKGTILGWAGITLVASLFYGAVWTCQTTVLCEKLEISGFIALGHFMLGGMIYAFNE